MKTYFMLGRAQKGFTLGEIIITILLASMLGLIFTQFMGTGMIGSVEPLLRVQNAFKIQQVMENITADYKKKMAEDADPVGNLEDSVGKEGDEFDNDYGKYKVVCNHYISFDDDGNETSVGDSILKVTIEDVNGKQRLTALFTK